MTATGDVLGVKRKRLTKAELEDEGFDPWPCPKCDETLLGEFSDCPFCGVPLEPCSACAMEYHGVCEGRCGCPRTDVDHNPDWDALRRENGDD